MTYFSPVQCCYVLPDGAYYELSRGPFFGQKFDVTCLSTIKKFIAYLTLFHIRKTILELDLGQISNIKDQPMNKDLDHI